MEEITVRNVKPEDYKDISILSTELGYQYPVEKMRQRISYLTYHTADIILVADNGSSVVGYVHASPYQLMYQDPIMNILGFVVKEELRRQGIGHLLITEIERHAIRHGFKGFRLTSGDQRLAAHHFYEKHGFTTNKTSKKYVKSFEE